MGVLVALCTKGRPEALQQQPNCCARVILRAASCQSAAADSVWRRAGVRRDLLALMWRSLWSWMRLWQLMRNSESIKYGAEVGDVESFAWQADAQEPFADLLDSWEHRPDIQ